MRRDRTVLHALVLIAPMLMGAGQDPASDMKPTRLPSDETQLRTLRRGADADDPAAQLELGRFARRAHDSEAAFAWYDSADYVPYRNNRHTSSNATVVSVAALGLADEGTHR